MLYRAYTKTLNPAPGGRDIRYRKRPPYAGVLVCVVPARRKAKIHA